MSAGGSAHQLDEIAAREERWRKAATLMTKVPAMADDLRTMLRHDMARHLGFDLNLVMGGQPAPFAAPPPPIAASIQEPLAVQHAAPLHIAAQVAPPTTPGHAAPPSATSPAQARAVETTPAEPTTARPAPTTPFASTQVEGTAGALPIQTWRTARETSSPSPSDTGAGQQTFGKSSFHHGAKKAAAGRASNSPERSSPFSNSSSVVPASKAAPIQTGAPPSSSVPISEAARNPAISSSTPPTPHYTWMPFNDAATDVLKAAFKKNPDPSRDEVQALRAQFGIPKSIPKTVSTCPIYTWFASQRKESKAKAARERERLRQRLAKELGDSPYREDIPSAPRQSPGKTTPTAASAKTVAVRKAPPRPPPPTSTLTRSFSLPSPPVLRSRPLRTPKPNSAVHSPASTATVTSTHWDGRKFDDTAREILEEAFTHTPKPDRETIGMLRRQLGFLRPIPSALSECPVFKWFCNRRRPIHRRSPSRVHDYSATLIVSTELAATQLRNLSRSEGKEFRPAVDADSVVPVETMSASDEAILQAAFDADPRILPEKIDALRVRLGLPSRAGWKHLNYMIWHVGCPVYQWFIMRTQRLQREKASAKATTSEMVAANLSGAALTSVATDGNSDGEDVGNGLVIDGTEDDAMGGASETPMDVTTTATSTAIADDVVSPTSIITQVAVAEEAGRLPPWMNPLHTMVQESRKRPNEEVDKRDVTRDETEVPVEEGDSTSPQASKRQRLKV